MNLKKVCCSILIVSLVTLGAKADEFKAIPFQSKIENVQPMTGIVMWGDSKNSHSDAIQLEFSYLKYSDVVKGKDRYDWKVVEKILNRAKARKHQAVLRFWDTYPGKPSGMPAYFKNEPGYKMLTAESENRDTGFPDWSHAEPKKFVLEFYEKFAERYDNDPRLAFLEVGFGLWAEYHIYSGPEIPGKTFPGRTFQATFVQHMDKVMKVNSLLSLNYSS